MSVILKQPADTHGSLRLPVHAVLRPPAVVPATPSAPVATVTAAAVPRVDPAALQARQEAELAALREQAAHDGFAQGRAMAETEARAALDAEVHRWRSGIEGMAAALQDKLQALEPLAVAVAYEALVATLGQAFADGSGIEHSVRRLLQETAGATTLLVRVAPAHLPRVQAALAELPAGAPRSLQFEADGSQGEHGCSIVSERGQLETSLSLQLQAVTDALLGAKPKATE